MDRWVKAGIVDTRFEGDRVSEALKESEIPFLIQSFQDTAYDGLFIFQKGWGAVLVPEEFREQTEQLIDDVKKTFQEEAGDEADECEGGPNVCDPEGG
jgi:hypothetical protein